MKIIERLGIALLIAAFVLLIGGCIRWEWRECRHVGHGVMYCIYRAWDK